MRLQALTKDLMGRAARWRGARALRRSIAILLAIVFATPAIESVQAQTSPPPYEEKNKTGRSMEFDIPAQSLELALSTFGATTQIQLFVDAELTAGRQSAALKGTFVPEIALNNLLAGTGLAARAIDDQGFTLVSLSTSAAGTPARDAASPMVLRFNRYSAALQDAMRSALCQREETAPGSYRALVRFWIGGSGAVARTELVTSTGDDRRDALLAAVFRGLAIGTPPPADMPQPVTLLVTSDARSAGYCSGVRRALSRAAMDGEPAR